MHRHVTDGKMLLKTQWDQGDPYTNYMHKPWRQKVHFKQKPFGYISINTEPCAKISANVSFFNKIYYVNFSLS